jgi:hypothetical protein
MAKIFYCGGLSGRLAMLRAVISAAALSSVLSKEAKCLGKSFPKMKQTDPQSTVIEVLRDEQGQSEAGFYRASKGPLQFEGHLQAIWREG